MQAEEMLVSALPLKLWILRGAAEGGALRIIAEGFDPIEVRPPGKIILRSEGLGVVIERIDTLSRHC